MTGQTINQGSNHARLSVCVSALMFALLICACDPTPAPNFAQLPGAPPARADAVAQAWIEFPREGKTVPMAPLTFVVYATDPHNIAQIDLRVNGQAPAGVGLPRGLDADGGYRLARLDHTWQPPAEGEYILEARARNSAGAYGLPTIVKFCVGTCKTTPTPAPYPTWTPTPAALPGTPITPTPSHTPITAVAPPPPPPITPTPTRTPITVVAPPPPPPASINFRSDAPYVNGGSCTTLRWDVDNVQAVTLDGQGVVGHGSQQVCPCQQTTYTLRVVKRDNTTEDRQVTIMVYGSCAPPTVPPTWTQPPPTRTPVPPPTRTPVPPPTRTPVPPPTPTTIKW